MTNIHKSMCSLFVKLFYYALNFTYYASDFMNYVCMLKATNYAQNYGSLIMLLLDIR